MQLFAYRRTEAGIRRIAREMAQAKQARDYEKEIGELRDKIDVLEARIGQRDPVILEPWKEKHWTQYPVFKSRFQRIEDRACKLFRISRAELHSARRYRGVVLARQFVMYWACRLTTLSLPQIGRLMGGRDHTTVLHGRDAYPVKRAAMGRTLRPAK